MSTKWSESSLQVQIGNDLLSEFAPLIVDGQELLDVARKIFEQIKTFRQVLPKRRRSPACSSTRNLQPTVFCHLGIHAIVSRYFGDEFGNGFEHFFRVAVAVDHLKSESS